MSSTKAALVDEVKFLVLDLLSDVCDCFWCMYLCVTGFVLLWPHALFDGDSWKYCIWNETFEWISENAAADSKSKVVMDDGNSIEALLQSFVGLFVTLHNLLIPDQVYPLVQ